MVVPINKTHCFQPCRFALGPGVAGTEQVVYRVNATLCNLRNAGLFIVTVPETSTSTLPPAVMTCKGKILPITFSGATAATAAGIIGGRPHLASIECIDGVLSLNIYDAPGA
jgi:hypothetical protein